jgi:hypothetical protein
VVRKPRKPRSCQPRLRSGGSGLSYRDENQRTTPERWFGFQPELVRITPRRRVIVMTTAKTDAQQAARS